MSCGIVACQPVYEPVYESEENAGIFIGERSDTSGSSTFFKFADHPTPFMYVSADQKNGLVYLTMMNQEMNRRTSDEKLKIFCNTAKLINDDEKVPPVSTADKVAAVWTDNWRIKDCGEEDMLQGEEKLVGIRITFNSSKPLQDTFKILLPEVDYNPSADATHDNGFACTSHPPVIVKFKKQMKPEPGGWH